MTIGPIIKIGATVATQVYKHRKAIYAVLTAQDRYISKSFRYGGYGKATSYGVRSGALVGSVVGAFITQGDNNLNDGIQKIQPTKQPQTGKSYKTRRGPARRSSFKCRPNFRYNRNY